MKTDEPAMKIKRNIHNLINHLNSLNKRQIITIKHWDWGRLLITAR